MICRKLKPFLKFYFCFCNPNKVIFFHFFPRFALFFFFSFCHPWLTLTFWGKQNDRHKQLPTRLRWTCTKANTPSSTRWSSKRHPESLGRSWKNDGAVFPHKFLGTKRKMFIEQLWKMTWKHMGSCFFFHVFRLFLGRGSVTKLYSKSANVRFTAKASPMWSIVRSFCCFRHCWRFENEQNFVTRAKQLNQRLMYPGDLWSWCGDSGYPWILYLFGQVFSSLWKSKPVLSSCRVLHKSLQAPESPLLATKNTISPGCNLLSWQTARQEKIKLEKTTLESQEVGTNAWRVDIKWHQMHLFVEVLFGGHRINHHHGIVLHFFTCLKQIPVN